MTTATSASDRYGAAREALEYAENIHVSYPAAHKRLTAALRALIEPPAVEIPDAEETQRIYTDAYYRHRKIGGTIAELEAAHTAGREALYQAGIQAAWESWEPENAPGVRVGTIREHDDIRQLVRDVIADATEGDVRAEDYYIERVFDALGVRL